VNLRLGVPQETAGPSTRLPWRLSVRSLEVPWNLGLPACGTKIGPGPIYSQKTAFLTPPMGYENGSWTHFPLQEPPGITPNQPNLPNLAPRPPGKPEFFEFFEFFARFGPSSRRSLGVLRGEWAEEFKEFKGREGFKEFEECEEFRARTRQAGETGGAVAEGRDAFPDPCPVVPEI